MPEHKNKQEQPFSDYNDYINYSHTLSYYGENGRNPYKPLFKIARRLRRQLDPF
jgi:hypothetical protein